MAKGDMSVPLSGTRLPMVKLWRVPPVGIEVIPNVRQVISSVCPAYSDMSNILTIIKGNNPPF